MRLPNYQRSILKYMIPATYIFMLGILILLGYFIYSRVQMEGKLNEAQIRQIGKPVEVNYQQYYHTEK